MAASARMRTENKVRLDVGPIRSPRKLTVPARKPAIRTGVGIIGYFSRSIAALIKQSTRWITIPISSAFNCNGIKGNGIRINARTYSNCTIRRLVYSRIELKMRSQGRLPSRRYCFFGNTRYSWIFRSYW